MTALPHHGTSVIDSHPTDFLDLEWVPCPAPPRLDQNAIHLWYVGLDVASAVLQRLKAHLSLDERMHAASMASPEAKLRFAVTRGVLRSILGSYLKVAPESLVITQGPWGKPELGDASADTIRFNVSHAGDHAVVAVTEAREVGVDIECDRPITHLERLARRMLAPSEWEALQSTRPAERPTCLLGFWTRKEALAKARGVGIFRCGMRSIDLGPLPRDVHWRSIRPSDDAGSWSLRSFDLPAPDCMGAVCVEGPAADLLAFRWCP